MVIIAYIHSSRLKRCADFTLQKENRLGRETWQT